LLRHVIRTIALAVTALTATLSVFRPAEAERRPAHPVQVHARVSEAVLAQQDIVKAFQPLGPGAVRWGLAVARCESGYNPNAVNASSGATGLFQFMPSTFAATPPGRAGGSIWDPAAQSQAAAWMFSHGRRAAWTCQP
jgi:Transglycosylase SLT domain